jgi:hypothetical protein
MGEINGKQFEFKALVHFFLIIGIKFSAHISGLEFLSIKNLFSRIIEANVFIIGFLLSGVHSDYRESICRKHLFVSHWTCID